MRFTVQESARNRFEKLQTRWELLRCTIDTNLAQYTSKLSSDCPAQLKEAIEYSLLAPGKRLRPLLVLLTAEAVGGDPQKVIPAACAVEFIHCYSLIHDDLPAMDDDDLRRGMPTCHKKFDEATAILAGDALQAMAFQLLASEVRPGGIAAICCALLAAAAGPEALVGGQMDDLLAEKKKEKLASDGDLLQAIHRRKTGAMIEVSVQLGALVGAGSTKHLELVRQYGESIGLAFQIVDDILDVESDASTLGKKTGKDSAKGKLTYPGVFGLEKSRDRAAELIETATASIEGLGEAALPLMDLARFVLDRSH